MKKNSNSFLASILLAIVFFSCINRPQGTTDPSHYPEKPNIIFFIADDMYPEMFN